MTGQIHAESWILLTMLQVAVPLRIAELADMSDYERDRVSQMWRAEAAGVLPAGGQHIATYRKTPENPQPDDQPLDRLGSAGMFNLTAKAVAVLARSPGGVSMFGLVWCAEHYPTGIEVDRPSETAHCPECAMAEATK